MLNYIITLPERIKIVIMGIIMGLIMVFSCIFSGPFFNIEQKTKEGQIYRKYMMLARDEIELEKTGRLP